MKRKIICLMLTAAMVLTLAGCTTTVEDEKMTLKLNGIGKRTGTYTGEVSGDLPNGNGRFDTKNKAGKKWYYDGEWVEGQFEGEGEQYWPELGQKFVGSHKNGFLSGNAEEYQNDKLLYKGEWKKDDWNGAGKLYNQSGDVTYEGNFKNGHPRDKATIRKNAQAMSYSDLARNPNKHIGKIVKISATAFQVVEGDNNEVDILTQVGYDGYDVLYIFHQYRENESRTLMGDNITVYGVFDGLYTYETTDGNDLTVPLVISCFISR